VPNGRLIFKLKAGLLFTFGEFRGQIFSRKRALSNVHVTPTLFHPVVFRERHTETKYLLNRKLLERRLTSMALLMHIRGFLILALLSLTCPPIFSQEMPAPAPWPQVRILLTSARDPNTPFGLPLRMLFDFPVRDANISTGPGGYYLVATTASATKPVSMWWENDGVRMWKSSDLVHWYVVTGSGEPSGFVWTFNRDATWAKAWKKSPFVSPHGELRRALWAPEIHYFRGTFWIPYSMNYGGTGLLRSTSGKADGPYVDVKADGPLTSGIDASIFADDDGSVYFLNSGYSIAKMRPDLRGLAESPHDIDVRGKQWGEGIYMIKLHGHYIFINSGNPHNENPTLPDTYDCFSAVSDRSPYGHYSRMYRAIPFDGHNNLFRDKKGNWWSSFFGSGPNNPWVERSGLIAVSISPDGHVSPKRLYSRPEWSYSISNPGPSWTSGAKAWSRSKTGKGAFGDPAVARSGFFTDVGTTWTSGEIWLRRSFKVKSNIPAKSEFYLRTDGPVEIFLNGQLAAESKAPMIDYVTLPFASSAALRTGRNVIVVHATAMPGVLPYIDVGIVDGKVTTPLTH
jgi:hypothetical protein